MRRCPHCGYSFDEQPVVSVETLRQQCKDSRWPIFTGDRVNESTAAQLLGVAPGTLRNWRSSGRGPDWVRSGGSRGTVSYKLEDLAAWFKHGE